MTALAEALLAAQRQAIGALGKHYLAGLGGDEAAEALHEALDRIGCTDKVEQTYLATSLEYLRQLGAPAPRATQPEPQGPKPQSPGQRKYVMDLFRKADIEPLPDADLDALNFDRTSDLIDALKNGTYDHDEWSIPF